MASERRSWPGDLLHARPLAGHGEGLKAGQESVQGDEPAGRLSARLSLRLTCTLYYPAKFLCRNSCIFLKASAVSRLTTGGLLGQRCLRCPGGSKVSSCSLGSWTQGVKSWVGGVQQAEMTEAQCSGPASLGTSQSQGLDGAHHPTALRNHHMPVLLPHAWPHYQSPASTLAKWSACRMVIFLNPVFIKASTEGTQEAKLAIGAWSNTGVQQPAGWAEGDRSHSWQAPRTWTWGKREQ